MRDFVFYKTHFVPLQKNQRSIPAVLNRWGVDNEPIDTLRFLLKSPLAEKRFFFICDKIMFL